MQSTLESVDVTSECAICGSRLDITATGCICEGCKDIDPDCPPNDTCDCECDEDQRCDECKNEERGG